MKNPLTARASWSALKLFPLFLSLMCCLVMPAAAQLTALPPNCANPPVYNYTFGSPSTVWTYTGNYTFPVGNIHVVGTLRFETGTFTVLPGTRFYIDGKVVIFNGRPRVGGYRLVLGPGAHFQADGAVFTAACNNNVSPAAASMWNGFLFESGQDDQSLRLSNGCVVAYAEYGVYVPGVSQTTPYPTRYDISNCRFEQNLYGVYDLGMRDSNHQANLTDVTLLSQPSLLPPYQANPYDTWSVEALHLTPTRSPGSNISGASLTNNISIDGGVYGVVANQPGQAPISFDGNLDIHRVLRAGIWLDDAAALTRFPTHTVIDMNLVTINNRSYQSFMTKPAEHMYGIVGNSANMMLPNVSGATVYIYGGSGSDTTAYRAQTGAFINQNNDKISNFSLENLTYGLSLGEGYADIKGNAFTRCWNGIRVRPNLGYTVSFNISCNDFTGNQNSASAILVDNQAQLNQQGDINRPQGNKFDGYQNGLNSLMNRNLSGNFMYYRYQGSNDEQATRVTDGDPFAPFTTGNVFGTTSPYPLGPSTDPNSFCRVTQDVATGAHARGTSLTAYMQAVMDTLRRQAAPATRLRMYQAAVRRWLLVEQPDTAALEAYVGTLPTTNPGAFFGLGLDLLEQYRRANRQVAVARLRTLLAARVAGYPAAGARLTLFDVVGRAGSAGPWPTRKVTAADSAALRRVARTPGGTAEMAALWFNYLYPGVGLQPAVARTGAAGQSVGSGRGARPVPQPRC